MHVARFPAVVHASQKLRTFRRSCARFTSPIIMFVFDCIGATKRVFPLFIYIYHLFIYSFIYLLFIYLFVFFNLLICFYFFYLLICFFLFVFINYWFFYVLNVGYWLVWPPIFNNFTILNKSIFVSFLIDINLLSIDFPFNQKNMAPKVFVHNRVPSKQLHYWGSGSLMGYPLEKLFGCYFLISV